ncbi:hypothetical protein ACK3OH_004519 [Salmonella enterica]
MKSQFKLKYLEVAVINFILTMFAFVLSTAGTLFSYSREWSNPIIYIASLFMNGLRGIGKVPGEAFPKTYHELFTRLDNSSLFSNGFFQLLFMGIVALLCLYATFFILFQITGGLTYIIERHYIKYRFGNRFLRAYEKLANRGKKRSQKIEGKASEKESLDKASYSHYEKWKEYYKSDLSFEDWKIKVMGERSDSEVGK